MHAFRIFFWHFNFPCKLKTKEAVANSNEAREKLATNQTILPIEYFVKTDKVGTPKFLKYSFVKKWSQAGREYKTGQIWKLKNGTVALLLGLRHANPAITKVHRK